LIEDFMETRGVALSGASGAAAACCGATTTTSGRAVVVDESAAAPVANGMTVAGGVTAEGSPLIEAI